MMLWRCMGYAGPAGDFAQGHVGQWHFSQGRLSGSQQGLAQVPVMIRVLVSIGLHDGRLVES